MAGRMRVRHPGRAWAYTGSIAGGLLSLAANAVSLALPPLDAPDGWTPNMVAVWTAMVWPALLFIGFEILTRVDWTRGYRSARWLGMLPVMLVPAVISYRHMFDLLARLGEDRIICALGPLAVDGLMVMASMALMSQAAAARAARSPLSPAYRPA